VRTSGAADAFFILLKPVIRFVPCSSAWTPMSMLTGIGAKEHGTLPLSLLLSPTLSRRRGSNSLKLGK
jgi:hypothetical protein